MNYYKLLWNIKNYCDYEISSIIMKYHELLWNNIITMKYYELLWNVMNYSVNYSIYVTSHTGTSSCNRAIGSGRGGWSDNSLCHNWRTMWSWRPTEYDKFSYI